MASVFNESLAPHRCWLGMRSNVRQTLVHPEFALQQYINHEVRAALSLFLILAFILLKKITSVQRRVCGFWIWINSNFPWSLLSVYTITSYHCHVTWLVLTYLETQRVTRKLNVCWQGSEPPSDKEYNDNQCNNQLNLIFYPEET